jgi:hypothetical protein
MRGALNCLGDLAERSRVTLDEAVAILNEQCHHDHSQWYSSRIGPEDFLVRGKDQYEFFTAFEAIAIAEKYNSEFKKTSIRSKPLNR